MDVTNPYIFATVLVALLVAAAIFFFRRKRPYSDEELSWRRAVAISTLRLSRYEFLDRKKISELTAKKTGSAIAAKFLRLLQTMKTPVSASDLKDSPKFEALVAQVEKDIDKLGISRNDLFKLAFALWEIGIVGYGLPIAEIIADERLLTPILYRLAQGDDFHFNAEAATELEKLRGLYFVFSKTAGQKNISKSILFIAGYQTHEEIKTSDGASYRDHRAVAFEISKDPRFQNPIIRGGTFIPFLPQSMAFLSLRSKVCDDLRAGSFTGLFDPQSQLLSSPGVTLDESFKYVSLERRPGELLRGTYLNRDIVGKLVGIKFEASIDDAMIADLGLLNDSELEHLHDLERIAVDELRASFDGAGSDETPITQPAFTKK